MGDVQNSDDLTERIRSLASLLKPLLSEIHALLVSLPVSSLAFKKSILLRWIAPSWAGLVAGGVPLEQDEVFVEPGTWLLGIFPLVNSRPQALP